MDILSRDTLALLSDRTLRDTIEELLRNPQPSAVVTVNPPDESKAASQEPKQIVVRRIA